jgi:hypothetical protein
MHKIPNACVNISIVATVAAMAHAFSPATAQQSNAVVKTWQASGAWTTTLVRRGPNGYLCMLNSLGNEPHSFGASFMEMPGKLLFMIDDRTQGLHYLPTMTVSVDGNEIATYNTFNDPPMTSTAPDDGEKVKALMDRLSQGRTLTVDARRTRYSLSLDGFAAATAQFASCKSEMAKLASGPAQ